ncbi:LPXTG-motif protein cell wall anchor domain protein [Enterococcus faecalis 06-MB-DW-09]|nr:LPXTG-motif protein cell wall anchor domain protein [Enterococcus faecalis 06-MB-DW-09]
MRRRLIVLLIGLCFFAPFVLGNALTGRATTNENRAVVSFYQEDERNNLDKDDSENLPQTGSTFSYMGILGGFVVFVTWYLRRAERKKL